MIVHAIARLEIDRDLRLALGLVLALWGLGSLVGGLLYGAMSRPISAFWLPPCSMSCTRG